MKYLVKRSKRRRTLSMHFDHSGQLIVNAPYGVSAADIERFIEAHRGWVTKQIAAHAHPNFADGERVELMGRTYVIAAGPQARMMGETLLLPAEGREAALIGLLRKLTRERMQRYLDELCKTYGFCYTRLAVTSARGRWGSCSTKGHVSFSFRGAFLPDHLAYYLAVHELCHTRSFDHSPRFWAEVAKILPDFRTRRAELKRYQWAMNCL